MSMFTGIGLTRQHPTHPTPAFIAAMCHTAINGLTRYICIYMYIYIYICDIISIYVDVLLGKP